MIVKNITVRTASHNLNILTKLAKLPFHSASRLTAVLTPCIQALARASYECFLRGAYKRRRMPIKTT